MIESFVTHAFSAGVLAPAFRGRVDLDKYDIGVAKAHNFYVDFRGGLKSRAGTRFLSEQPPGRLFSFPTGETISDVLVLFSAGEIRLFLDGAAILSGGVPLVLSSPYTASQVNNLRYHYRANEARVTHSSHPPYVLRFDAATSAWSFTKLEFTPSLLPPANIVDTAAAGPASTIVVVTAVDADGVESVSSPPYFVNGIVNYTVTAGSLQLTWDAVPTARSYRVYRSIVTENLNLNRAQDVGFIGETFSTSFIDQNIIPDFTQQPPRNNNPVTPGSIFGINVTAGGTGYGQRATVSITSATGSGFLGYPVVDGDAVVDVAVLDSGADYIASDTVVFGGAGTGATATISDISPATGVFPRVSTVFQQRQIFAGASAAPLAIHGSRPGAFTNFNTSTTPTEADAYTHVLDAEEVVPILFAQPVRDSLLLFHSRGVERLMANEGRAVSAINKAIENQSSEGVGEVAPAVIGADVLFANNSETALIAMNFSAFTNSFTPQDLSVLASHLFSADEKIAEIAWTGDPEKLLWVRTTEGRLRTLTYLREQEVFAWASHETQGKVKSIRAVRDLNRTALYLLVERFLNGAWTHCLEVMEERDASHVEWHWGVDSGLQTALPAPTSTLAVASIDTSGPLPVYTFQLSQNIATQGDIGKDLRAYGGKFRVTAVPGPAQFVAEELIPPNPPIAGVFRTLGGTAWTLAPLVTSVTGLTHLAGQTVSVLADGDALINQTVAGDGSLTLPAPASLITVGLPFVGEIETLPLADPARQTEGKRKRLAGTAVRLQNTRGLLLGTSATQLFDMKDRGFEDWSQETQLRSDNSLVLHSTRWARDASLIIQQPNPLPATVLGLVLRAEEDDGGR